MFKVNKNLDYNGNVYAKDSEIKETDPGFKELKQAGHVEEVEGQAKSQPVEKPVEPAKPATKSKK
jgi:hypothetical protein